MAKHAQPREVAKLKGADKVHPERYRKKVPKSDSPVGSAPEGMSESARACWFELESYAIPGTLTWAERPMLEMAANLFAEYRAAPTEFAIGKYNPLIGMLARFGLSPADRQKLSIDSPKEDDPYDNLEQ